MPCIWGRHNRSQVFLNVAIIEDGVTERVSRPAPGQRIRFHVFSALVDTGAQSTCISREAAERVGLIPIGKVPIRGVSGLSYHNNYLFRVGFAFGEAEAQNSLTSASLHIFDKTIQGAELNIAGGAFDVLLGMDIIGTGSLKIDGDGSFSFSF